MHWTGLSMRGTNGAQPMLSRGRCTTAAWAGSSAARLARAANDRFRILADRRPRPEGAPHSPGRQGKLRRLGQSSARPRTARCSPRIGFDGKTAGAFALLPRGNEIEVVARGREMPTLVALVPGQARRQACPKALIGWRRASRARRRSAGCSPSIASIATARDARRKRRGPRVLLTGEAARIDADGPPRRGDRAGPRPRQHARRRPWPGRARGRGARRLPRAPAPRSQ